MASTAWTVEAPCPQCGAPVTLDEADRLLGCGYCRVRLFVTTSGCLRYCLPPRSTHAGDVVMVPYWRLRGSRFRCVRWEVVPSVVDLSRLACKAPGLPASLGVRPQALKLRFAGPDLAARFLAPVGSPPTRALPGSAIARVPDPFLEGEEEVLFETQVARTSIVYAPVRLTGRVLDAVLDRQFGPMSADAWVAATGEANSPPPPLHFVPTLCPQCGWQLEGQSDSVVLLCPQCQSAWQGGAASLVRVAHRTLPTAGWAADVHVPFWRASVQVDGVPLSSWADFIRFANLPRYIKREWEGEPLWIWIPAFKVSPDQFLRFGRTLTIARPSLDDAAPPGPCDVARPDASRRAQAANLPLEAIDDAVKTILADFSQPKTHVFPRLHEISVHVTGTTLVYVPLASTGQEFRNPELALSFHPNLLTFSRNL